VHFGRREKVNGRAGRGQLRERLNWDKVLSMLDVPFGWVNVTSFDEDPASSRRKDKILNGQGNQAGKISAERNRNVLPIQIIHLKSGILWIVPI
jgi:hypothetical protein